MRQPPSIIVLLLAGYVECILLTLWDAVGGLILPPLPFIVRFAAFWGAPFFGFLIFLWALQAPRSWRRWRIVAAAGVIGLLVLAFVPRVLFDYGLSRFVRRPDLNAFVADVHRYRRITSIRAVGEDFSALNGTRVARTRIELDSLREQWDGKDAMLLSEVLARDSIDPAIYGAYRHTLRDLHLTTLTLEGDYVRLGRSRELSLVHALPGAAPPSATARPIDGGKEGDVSMSRWYD